MYELKDDKDPAPPIRTLDQLRSGEWVEIVAVDDDTVRSQAMRLGIHSGALVTCVTKVPAGPIVLGHGRQEIAIGRNLAKKITVTSCSTSNGRGD